MKNFKLLLATTAILSTGLAIIANASNTEDFDVTVQFVADSSISKKQDMDFGKISVQQGQQYQYLPGSVTISPEGEVTATNMNYYGGAKQPIFMAQIRVDGAEIILPTEIELEYSDDQKCATVNNFVIGDIMYGNACGGSPCPAKGVGATLNYDPTKHITTSGYACTGSFTISIMVPEE